jgi:hypothetical protein
MQGQGIEEIPDPLRRIYDLFEDYGAEQDGGKQISKEQPWFLFSYALSVREHQPDHQSCDQKNRDMDGGKQPKLDIHKPMEERISQNNTPNPQNTRTLFRYRKRFLPVNINIFASAARVIYIRCAYRIFGNADINLLMDGKIS